MVFCQLRQRSGTVSTWGEVVGGNSQGGKRGARLPIEGGSPLPNTPPSCPRKSQKVLQSFFFWAGDPQAVEKSCKIDNYFKDEINNIATCLSFLQV